MLRGTNEDEQGRGGHGRDSGVPWRPSRAVVEAGRDAVTPHGQAGSQLSCDPSLVGSIGTFVLAGRLGGNVEP